MGVEHQANICRHLKRAAKETPASLAVAVQKRLLTGKYRYQELSFGELDADSDRIARVLADYGITRGMKAVLMVTPSLDFFCLDVCTVQSWCDPDPC